MQADQVPAKQWLIDEFERRRHLNPRYSMRAFAKALDLPSGRLSEILSGKREIGNKLGPKLAEKLELGPVSRQRFLRATRLRDTRGELDLDDRSFAVMNDDAFRAIGDWQHYAILSLIKTKGFKDDPAWIGRRLGISSTLATASLRRLKRLKLIEFKNGRLVRTHHQITTSDGTASVALRKSHRQNLEQSIAALENLPVEVRSISSMTMAIETRKLAAANFRIKAFRRELSEFLEAGRADEVYNLNIQLVPLTKPEK